MALSGALGVFVTYLFLGRGRVFACPPWFRELVTFRTRVLRPCDADSGRFAGVTARSRHVVLFSFRFPVGVKDRWGSLPRCCDRGGHIDE